MPNPTEIAVALKATNLEQVQAALATVRSDVQRTATASADASAKVTASASDVAAANTRVAQGFQLALSKLQEVGTLGSASLSGVAGSAMQLATVFLPGGVLGGAVATLTGHIIRMFITSREEMQKTREKFEAELSRMAGASESGKLQTMAEQMWRGQYNVKSGQYENGVAALLAERQRYRDEPNKILGGMELNAFNRRKLVIDGEKVTVEELIKRYELLAKAIMDLPGARSSLGALPAVATKVGGKTTDAKAPGFFDDVNISPWGRGSAIDTTEKRQTGREFSDRGEVSLAGGAAQVASNDKITREMMEALRARLEAVKKEGERRAAEVGGVLGTGVAAGFAAAVQHGNLGEGFQALTGAFMAGFGAMLVQIGEKGLAASELVKGLVEALSKLDGTSGILASLGLIALGGILQGLGGRTSSQSSVPVGAGPGAVGAAGGGTVINRGTIGASSLTLATAGTIPAGTTPVSVTVIGSDDPRAQADIMRIVTKARARGLG